MSKTVLPAVLAFALLFPAGVLADSSGTATFNSGQNFSFDSGTTSASSGDIKFTGSSITVVGTATAFNEGAVGSFGYTGLTQQQLLGFYSANLFNAVPISGPSLISDDVFAVHTNGGNIAKAWIIAVSSSSITFQYTTYGSTTGGGGGSPTISQVLNNYGLVPTGFANSGIAQGSLFIIKGSGLADPNAQATPLQDSSKGLPTTLNGASVKIVDASGARLRQCSTTLSLGSSPWCCPQTPRLARLSSL